MEYIHGRLGALPPVAVWLAILAGVAVSGLRLAAIVLLEAQGPVDGDVLIYTAVARGILNGLTPYVDLFESKPPGMYFLMLASLFLTRGTALANVLHVLILLAIPIIVAALVWREQRNAKIRGGRRTVVAALAFLVGTQLALLLEDWSPAAQTESFGAFFGLVYVLTISTRSTFTRYRTALATFCLLASIGLKEPFLFSNLAAALLICRSPRDFLRRFIIPLAVAAIAGLLVLAIVGYLGPYLNTYLPAMVEYRSLMNTEDPIWMRGLRVHKLLTQMTEFSIATIFGWGLALGWSLIPAMRCPWRGIRAAFLLTAATVATAVCIHFAYVLAKLLYFAPQLGVTISLGDPFVLKLVTGYLLGGAAYAGLLWFTWCQSRSCLFHVTAAAVGLYFAELATAAGGFFAQHAALAFPAFAAISIWMLRYLFWEHRSKLLAVVMSGLILLAALTTAPNPERLAYVEKSLGFRRTALEPLTSAVDTILEACGESRYLLIAGFPKTAYSKYSPIGPIFIQLFHDYLPPDHPLHQQTMRNAEQHARIAVNLRPNDTNHPLTEFIRAEFTEERPQCATGPEVPPDISVLFRKGWEGPGPRRHRPRTTRRPRRFTVGVPGVSQRTTPAAATDDTGTDRTGSAGNDDGRSRGPGERRTRDQPGRD